MSTRYRKQAADLLLAEAEDIASRPDLVDALHAAGANAHALVAHRAEALVATFGAESTHRTERLPPTTTTEVGTVAVRFTFGRGTEADEYPLLVGAPIGSVATLAGEAREAAAVADDIRAAKVAARGRGMNSAMRRAIRLAELAKR